MKFAVTIPFRPSDAFERQRNFELTRKHFEGFTNRITSADSGHLNFNRSESRNYGVRGLWGCDAVVVCDADFLPPLDAVLAACEGALADGRLHQPFDEALYLTEAETAIYLDDNTLPDRSGHDLTGGCFVMTPESWFAAGGMDPRFQGWGGEDDAFRMAAETLLGPRVHHKGVMPHLYHPSAASFGSDEHRGNLALLRRYIRVNGNPVKMRQLINEWS